MKVVVIDLASHILQGKETLQFSRVRIGGDIGRISGWWRIVMRFYVKVVDEQEGLLYYAKLVFN